jgi:nicotinamidase-related amidase
MGISASETVVDAWHKVEALPPPPVVPVTVDPAKTALFVMDFLRDVCTPEKRPRAAAMLPKLQAFLRQARARGMLVVHTTTRTGNAGELADAVAPIDGERVYSAKFDKFHGNDLEQLLRERGIDTVVATGTSANGCLLFTVAGAVLRNFKVIVPIDGMPAATPYQEQFVAWEIANAPVIHQQAVLTRFDAISFLK